MVCVAGISFAVPIDVYGEWNYLVWAILCAAAMERWIRREAPERLSILIWIGIISYSIYLLHDTILLQLLRRLPDPPGARFGFALISVVPLILVCAAVNYHLVELPGMGIGRRCLAWWFPEKFVMR